MIWIHAPLTSCRQFTPTLNASFRNAQALVSSLAGFTDVLVLSGHWHNNHTGTVPGSAAIREHNLGAISGSLWYNVKGFNGGTEYSSGPTVRPSATASTRSAAAASAGATRAVNSPPTGLSRPTT